MVFYKAGSAWSDKMKGLHMDKKNMKSDMESQDTKNLMERRVFLALAGLGIGSFCMNKPIWAKENSSTKPNILLILADDLGYADLGITGCKDIATPHIDSIAVNGVRFSNGYVSCPVCSPTRAGLMTGRYQQRFGHWYNPGPPAKESEGIGLPLAEVTMASMLKEAGYTTGLVGKWHLGHDPERRPMKRGYDEFFGFLGGSHDYFKAQAGELNGIRRGDEPVDEKEYLTEAFAREAKDFITRHKDGPFFLYLSLNAVHTPMQAPDTYLERFPDITDKQRRMHAAMVSAMDDAVGGVLGTLKTNGLYDNTLVLFLSDNGGPTQANGADNTPFSGGKGTVMEGGIRVPLFMQWPAKFPAGTVYERPVISLDILPTALSAAGGTVPENVRFDGKDLAPFITKKKRGEPHDTLFWAWNTQKVIRSGKWKLVVSDDGEHLYNLEKDPAETTDLAGEEPKRVKKLREPLDAWASELQPPLWKGRVQTKRRRPLKKNRPKKS